MALFPIKNCTSRDMNLFHNRNLRIVIFRERKFGGRFSSKPSPLNKVSKRFLNKNFKILFSQSPTVA